MKSTCLLFVLAFASGCGGAADPCEHVAGSCLDLTVISPTISRVESLEIDATGALTGQRSSTAGQLAPLPMHVAVSYPAASLGEVVFTVVARDAAAQPIGWGQGAVTLRPAQHARLTVSLGSSAPVADLGITDGDTQPADLSQEAAVDITAPADLRPPPPSGYLLLFSGESTDATISDAWVWDGSVWSPAPGAVPANTSEHPAMVFDSVRGRAVVIDNGNTYEWDKQSWVQRSTSGPSPRNFTMVAFDSARGRTVLFGGLGPADGMVLSDTWEWDGSTWSQSSAAGPAARFAAAMAYDPVRGRTILFGGTPQQSQINYQDMWQWDGNSWTELQPATTPSARANSSMAFDTHRGKMLLYGGGDGHGHAVSDFTWEWDGTTWTQLQPATTPSSILGGAAMAYDASRDMTVVFGGSTSDGIGTADTWAWNGVDWQKVSTSTHPSARADAVLCFVTP